MAYVLGPYTADAVNILSGIGSARVLGFYARFTTSGDPANPVTVDIYDNTANRGTNLLAVIEETGLIGGGNYQHWFPQPVQMDIGMSLDVTITSPGAVSFWVVLE